MTTTARSAPFIFCHVGREAYAIDADLIVNIEKLDQLQPASPNEGLAGWFPTADGGIPIHNLDQLLSRSSKPAFDKQRVLLLQKGEIQWGLLVNSLSPIIELPSDRIHPMPEIAINPATKLFRGVIRHSGHLILVLDLDQLYPNNVENSSAKVPSPEKVSVEVRNVDRSADDEAFLEMSSSSSFAKRADILLFFPPNQLSEMKNVTFGLSLTQIAEISAVPAMVPVPKGPDTVLGLILWRDNIVAVIDLNYSSGLSNTAYMPSDPNNQLIVARGFIPGQFVAFPVQSRMRALRLPIPTQPHSQSIPFNDGFARGIFMFNNETLVVPDLKHICTN